MKNFFVCLFALTLIMSPKCAHSNDPDFFYLVLTWPESFWNILKTRCVPAFGKPAANFMIHGLWPTFNNGSYPVNCANTPFDKSKVSTLIQEMEKNWPPLNCPNGDDGTRIWSHEWLKHGTCSKPLITNQFNYFETTLKLREKVDVLAALQKAGINPNGKRYSVANIIKAIKRGVGFVPKIQCNAFTSFGPSKIMQLYEVYFCMVDGSLEDCTKRTSFVSACTPFIIFPKFK